MAIMKKCRSSKPRSNPPTSADGATADHTTSTASAPATRQASSTSPLKRAREDDIEEVSPPPKKPAMQSSKQAGTKATKKPAPKRAPAKKRFELDSAPTSTSSRPTRTRKAPERFENLPPPPPRAPARKPASRVFDPEYITTNSTSRLVKADVYHMLLEPEAWNSLAPNQQETLVEMLPAGGTKDKALKALQQGVGVERPHGLRISNDCFRTDVAKFKEDLGNGHLAKSWLATATEAVAKRAAGEFDGWKAQEAEEWWGQKGDKAA